MNSKMAVTPSNVITLLSEENLPFSDSSVLKTVYLRVAKAYTQKIRNLNIYRDEITSLNQLVNSLYSSLPTVSQFDSFLRVVHNILLVTDTNYRVILLRVIRISLTGGEDYFNKFIGNSDMIWIVCTSFERDSEYLPERMQAHKIIKACVISCPKDKQFPNIFVRSLVSVANQKDDQLRRVSLEALRLLCVSNPYEFANGNGPTVLFDAILDPNFSDMSTSLLLSVLHSLSDEKSRKYLFARLDLRTLVRHFIVIITWMCVNNLAYDMKVYNFSNILWCSCRH